MELGLVEGYNRTKCSKLFPHEAPREARPVRLLRDWLVGTVRIFRIGSFVLSLP